jgi:oligopeptide/dipeptide ABC transporter ATP-binding protein
LDTKEAFKGIPGLPPSLLNRPTGCSFRTRCPHAMERCALVEPGLREVRVGRRVACHLFDNEWDRESA